MKHILNKLYQFHTLSMQEAEEIMLHITEGKYNSTQLVAFITVFNLRMPTLEEITGFRNALYKKAITLKFNHPTIDLCGTGGDGKDTFNISTLASFIVAGTGIKVSKHGNYSASSVSGSSNMLEHFGYQFSTEAEKLSQELEEANICFLHAPKFHPALKKIAGIRKELQVKTFFNILGPLLNPCKPKYQLTGVYNLETARIYKHIFNNQDTIYTILHTLDGYDEISLTEKTKFYSYNNEGIVEAKDFELLAISQEDIKGGNSIEENATIFKNVLENRATPIQKKVVLANAAMAIQLVKKLNYKEAYQLAQQSLEEEKALQSFNTLIKLQ